MHLVVQKRDLADKLPDLPGHLMDIFDEAKRQACIFYDDSNYSLMADAHLALEGKCRDFCDDQRQDGLAANRRNLEFFIG